MRTTLDLPDELLKRAKIAAVERGVTLRELVESALANDLAAMTRSGAEGVGRLVLDTSAYSRFRAGDERVLDFVTTTAYLSPESASRRKSSTETPHP
jgi:hypothetical protein